MAASYSPCGPGGELGGEGGGSDSSNASRSAAEMDCDSPRLMRNAPAEIPDATPALPTTEGAADGVGEAVPSEMTEGAVGGAAGAAGKDAAVRVAS